MRKQKRKKKQNTNESIVAEARQPRENKLNWEQESIEEQEKEEDVEVTISKKFASRDEC